MRYHIILSNYAGKLDETFAKDEDSINMALIVLVERCSFRDGDTIRIIDTNPED